SASGGASGNAVTFSTAGSCNSGGTNGATITITGAGSCTVTADQAGDANFNAAPAVAQSFTVAKADASVAVSWSDATYDATAHPASAQVNGVGGETGLAPAATFEYFTGSSVSGSPLAGAPVGAGTYTVRASFAGNGNYKAAHADQTITVAKAAASVDVTWAG